MSRPDIRRQTGFTIVELLIATTVFSLILVVITVGVMQFTKSYYKGVTASSTQNVARTTIDEVTQAVQFSGLKITQLPESPTAAQESNAKRRSKGFCVGALRYSYLPGWQLKTTSAPAAYQHTHVFVRDKPNGGCADNTNQTAQNLLTGFQGGTELLTTNMRVARADLVRAGGDPNLYNMTLRIIYGDADLLSSQSSPASNGRGDAYNATAPDATCKNATAGTQFCAASQLSTMIQRRVD